MSISIFDTAEKIDKVTAFDATAHLWIRDQETALTTMGNVLDYIHFELEANEISEDTRRSLEAAMNLGDAVLDYLQSYSQ